jgi:hypothetical protein
MDMRRMLQRLHYGDSLNNSEFSIQTWVLARGNFRRSGAAATGQRTSEIVFLCVQRKYRRVVRPLNRLT